MATYPIKMLRDEDRQAFVPFTNAAAVVDKDNKSLQELMDSGKYKIQNNVTTSSAGKGVLDAYQGKVLNDKFSKYVPLSQKGVANGVASLDAEGKVPSAQLPSYVDDVIESYIVSGSTALSAGWLSKTDGGTALTPEKGKIYLIMTSGAYQNKQYRWGGSTYILCNPSDVNSVNGMTGVVVLKKLTIQKNGTNVGKTFNGTTDEIINITVPTNNNQLTNGAGYITSAGSITGNAATATKATQDSAGNVIVDTYVKKAGDTMTGTLTISESGNLQVTEGMLKGDISTYRNHAIKLGHSGDNVMNFYEYGGEFNFYKSQNNADTLLGKITSQGWVGNVVGNVTGNATSATKATQDGNGKVIASTYLPLSGGSMTGAITLKGLVAQELAPNTDFNTLTHGIYHTGTDSNSKTMTNAPSAVSQGLIVITPYNSGSDNRTVQLSLDTTGDGALYYRTLRNGNTAWKTVVTSSNISNYKSGGTKAALTIQKNGTTVKTFDGSTAVTANITVPTKVSELTNDSNYVKNTTYASASTAGVVKLGTGLAIADGVLSVTGAATADSVEWSVVKNRPTAVSYWTNDAGYIKASNTMKGATSTTAGAAGTVPAPAAGKEAQFLRGDGTWAVPSYATSAGSATKATQDGNGKTIASTYLPLTGGNLSGTLVCATSEFGNALVVQRKGSTNQAAIQFKNDNGILGYISMGAVNGGLIRYAADVSTSYTILDTGNYTTHLDARYLNAGGDTLTGTISYALNGSWLQGSTGEKAIIKSTSAGSSHTALFSAASTNGRFQIFKYTNYIGMGYESNTNITAGTNSLDVGVFFEEGGHFYPSKNGTQYCGKSGNRWAGVHTNNVILQNAATITYNATDKCIEFNFS